MPNTAYHPISDDIHFAEQADPEGNYLCIDCEASVEYVRSYERNLGENGRTRVSAHFRYSNCTHGTVDELGDGGNGGPGGGSGETPIHKRRKRAALQEALNRFESVSYGTEQLIGSKRADALLEFNEPHEEYGSGLVIEYQHKNEGKDIETTEKHFARHGYTTVWLWEDQFEFTSSIPDIELFGGRVTTPWPDGVPLQSEWNRLGKFYQEKSKWESAHLNGLTNSDVEARIEFDWLADTPRNYWDKTDWSERFRYSDVYPEQKYRLQAAISPIQESIHSTIKLPKRLIKTLIDEQCTQNTVVNKSKQVRNLPDGIPHHLSEDTFDPNPPPTPFDDVQCRSCGNYQYAPSAGEICPNCGDEYHWRWNVRTGRISANSIPNGIKREHG